MNTTAPTTATNQVPPLRCPSHAVSRSRQANRQKEQHSMAKGPHLDADGHTLIVPSEWYNETAAILWQQHGFKFDKAAAAWKRDTRLPLTGKRYTTEVWLESTRRQFYTFWPTLLRKCKRCGKQFVCTNRYQTMCNDCTRLRQEAHDRHFSY